MGRMAGGVTGKGVVDSYGFGGDKELKKAELVHAWKTGKKIFRGQTSKKKTSQWLGKSAPFGNKKGRGGNQGETATIGESQLNKPGGWAEPKRTLGQRRLNGRGQPHQTNVNAVGWGEGKG